MYIPKAFEINDLDEIRRFVSANAFGQLISQVEGRLFSTHLPFLFADDLSRLSAHFAKQNPQLESLEGQEVMVTIEGPHDYISPSWYASAGVPTWNYQVVHIYGQCRLFDDASRLNDLLQKLTKKYESNFSRPWQVNYPPAMLNGIVGFEMTIKDIQCKFKLNQNRSKEDQQKVADMLAGLGSDELAKAMKKCDEQR